MAWDGPTDAPPTARIVALGPSLQPSERRILETILADLGAAVDSTAQELATTAGVGRASVIRAAQSLGYEGYPQLRVALAQELALGTSAERVTDDGTMLGALRAGVDRFGSRLGHTFSAITEETVQAFIGALDGANRVLVIANGLSAPLGLDMVLRLSAVGRPAELLSDPLAQQIAARHLGAGSVCLVLSGSGASRATLTGMTAAHDSGAQTLAITSFSRSPVAELADIALVVPPAGGSFTDELLHASRAALMLVTEGLVDVLVERRGGRGYEARATTLSVLGAAIQE
ncbi:RpiR family transcriptional regulator [Homoserinimonas aerilata]|uniref:RpiR family transcriptional regulator n=1 Tax=Homoserinimonas aerilata TaxID=1162970 RepID=A0A542YJL7_9MICO|nr:MurR/RpiR family transcriptional regulator [Homoserinimonas aerilata]TQL48231.1 RpiR family transcriptional regulator [Homoserinimonas aerilata]